MIDWKGWKVKYANAFGGSERALFLLQHDLFANFPAILAQHEQDQRAIEAAKKLRSDFVTAIAMRESQCRNSDVENEGGNPLNWDKTLMKWSATLAEFDKVVKP